VSDDTGQLNRFIIITAALFVAFLAGVVILLAWGDSSGAISWLEDFAGFLSDHDDNQGKLIVTLVALVVMLLMATVIVIELTPSPVEKVAVRDVSHGGASISTKEIAERIEADVVQVGHVAECRALVVKRGSRVEVVLDLHVDPEANLSATADDACRRAQELTEQQLGLELTQPPRARMHYRELRLQEEAPATGAVPHEMRRTEKPKRSKPEEARLRELTGWESPEAVDEGERERHRTTDPPEEAQAPGN
jgi:hypothetical protein